MTDLKAIIFDWDGTLVDSVQRIADCLLAAALDCDLPARAAAQYTDIIGLGMYEAIDRLYPGLSPDQVACYRDAYAVHFVHQDKAPSAFFSAVPAVLARLRGKGLKLAIATGKSRRGLDRSLRGLEAAHWFDASRCADETASKPDPKMLFELCSELGCSPSEAVMVGDTEYDLEMARNAGMPSIGVNYGVHAPERLALHLPRAVISDIAELEEFMGSNGLAG